MSETTYTVNGTAGLTETQAITRYFEIRGALNQGRVTITRNDGRRMAVEYKGGKYVPGVGMVGLVHYLTEAK